ncbi:MAG: hypothetical protein JWR80_4841 [Bradyrhizobium sp.]|nr:hypothetical protein [Bradyrhizobium sp.]
MPFHLPSCEMRTPTRSPPTPETSACTLSRRKRAGLDRAAIAVGAFVADVLQKLAGQIAIGPVQLDPV